MGKPADDRRDDSEQRLWREFGDHLKDLRLERGLERTQLAERAGVAYHTLTTLENGGKNISGEWVIPNPKDEQLAKLAHALGVTVESLFKQVGRYAERPRTKASRRGVGLRRDQDDELRRRFAEMEERVARVERQLAGEEPEEPARPRRRRGAS
jgi:transcriptional regulator with XRE-family HTH domain